MFAPLTACRAAVDCKGFEWVSSWVLELGRHARIEGPTEARQAMRERVARLRGELSTSAD